MCDYSNERLDSDGDAGHVANPRIFKRNFYYCGIRVAVRILCLAP